MKIKKEQRERVQLPILAYKCVSIRNGKVRAQTLTDGECVALFAVKDNEQLFQLCAMNPLICEVPDREVCSCIR